VSESEAQARHPAPWRTLRRTPVPHSMQYTSPESSSYRFCCPRRVGKHRCGTLTGLPARRPACYCWERRGFCVRSFKCRLVGVASPIRVPPRAITPGRPPPETARIFYVFNTGLVNEMSAFGEPKTEKLLKKCPEVHAVWICMHASLAINHTHVVTVADSPCSRLEICLSVPKRSAKNAPTWRVRVAVNVWQSTPPPCRGSLVYIFLLFTQCVPGTGLSHRVPYSTLHACCIPSARQNFASKIRVG